MPGDKSGLPRANPMGAAKTWQEIKPQFDAAPVGPVPARWVVPACARIVPHQTNRNWYANRRDLIKQKVQQNIHNNWKHDESKETNSAA